MSPDSLVAVALSVFVLAYLMYTLLRPERF